VKLGPVRPADGAGEADVPTMPGVPASLPPGRIAVVGRTGAAVGTGTTPVLLGDVRPEGRAAMAAADWVRGVRPAPDEGFT
jgi:methionyl-tRNA formyltransferase